MVSSPSLGIIFYFTSLPHSLTQYCAQRSTHWEKANHIGLNFLVFSTVTKLTFATCSVFWIKFHMVRTCYVKKWFLLVLNMSFEIQIIFDLQVNNVMFSRSTTFTAFNHNSVHFIFSKHRSPSIAGFSFIFLITQWLLPVFGVSCMDKLHFDEITYLICHRQV